MLAEGTEPAQQMGIAAELCQPTHLWESSMEIVEKPMSRGSVGCESAGPEREREGSDLCFEDLVEAEFGLSHGMCGVDKRVRFWIAREYSCHTSWGASWM